MLLQRAKDEFLRTLDTIEYGGLRLVTPDGRERHFEGKKPGFRAEMRLRDWRVVPHLAARGDHGFAESYKSGLVDSSNLQNLIALGLQNDNAIKRYVFGSQLSQAFSRFTYLFRLNSLRGSRKNIHAHYDLGNDFYSLWLDPTMSYSSALYKKGDEGMVEAQHNKYDRMIERLGADSGRVLEVGCGWGGFAERALEKGDFAVKGITLSDEQHAYATQRLGRKAEIVLEDYRIQNGKYDHIVSIEMFEAVGERYWNTYFSKMRGLLKDKGRAVIQTITIDDNRFERYRRGGDVIRSYIFPGGMLPSPSKFREEATKAGFRINDEFHFGQHYAKTLEVWLEDFDAKRAEVKALGYDDGFIRLWRFYLAACAAGFKTGRTSVMQVEMQNA